MSEDAPVNTGAVAWPDGFTASVTVRRMQTKLHRWATDDPGRCFGDLFNLVYDPAFLVAAWERVSANKGAQTAGIDKATAAMIETWAGVGVFLGQIRDLLKSGEFRPVEVGTAGGRSPGGAVRGSRRAVGLASEGRGESCRPATAGPRGEPRPLTAGHPGRSFPRLLASVLAAHGRGRQARRAEGAPLIPRYLVQKVLTALGRGICAVPLDALHMGFA